MRRKKSEEMFESEDLVVPKELRDGLSSLRHRTGASNNRGRTKPRSKKLEKRLQRLTRHTAHSSEPEPINEDTLRPLVDLAHYSESIEVRRDCAAAFATLSQNLQNIEILMEAGAYDAKCG